MSHSIGDTVVPSIQEVNFSFSEEQTETDIIEKDTNIISTGSEEVIGIEITFTLVEKIHPEGLSVEEQEKQVKSLANTDYNENIFQYHGMEGMISVNSVNAPEDAENDTIREGTIEGTFLPWPMHGFETPYGTGEYGSERYGL